MTSSHSFLSADAEEELEFVPILLHHNKTIARGKDENFSEDPDAQIQFLNLSGLDQFWNTIFPFPFFKFSREKTPVSESDLCKNFFHALS